MWVALELGSITLPIEAVPCGAGGAGGTGGLCLWRVRNVRLGWSLTCLSPEGQEEGQQEQEWLHLLRKAAQLGAAGALPPYSLLAPGEGEELGGLSDLMFPLVLWCFFSQGFFEAAIKLPSLN